MWTGVCCVLTGLMGSNIVAHERSEDMCRRNILTMANSKEARPKVAIPLNP